MTRQKTVIVNVDTRAKTTMICGTKMTRGEGAGWNVGRLRIVVAGRGEEEVAPTLKGTLRMLTVILQ